MNERSQLDMDIRDLIDLAVELGLAGIVVYAGVGWLDDLRHRRTRDRLIADLHPQVIYATHPVDPPTPTPISTTYCPECFLERRRGEWLAPPTECTPALCLEHYMAVVEATADDAWQAAAQQGSECGGDE